MVIVREDQGADEQSDGVWNEQMLTLLFRQHTPLLHLYDSWSKAKKSKYDNHTVTQPCSSQKAK